MSQIGNLRWTQSYQIAMSTGKDAGVAEVMQDGNVAPRETSVAKVAEENLFELGG